MRRSGRASSAGVTTAGGEGAGGGQQAAGETHLVVPAQLLTQGPWEKPPNSREAEHTRVTVGVHGDTRGAVEKGAGTVNACAHPKDHGARPLLRFPVTEVRGQPCRVVGTREDETSLEVLDIIHGN